MAMVWRRREVAFGSNPLDRGDRRSYQSADTGGIRVTVAVLNSTNPFNVSGQTAGASGPPVAVLNSTNPFNVSGQTRAASGPPVAVLNSTNPFNVSDRRGRHLGHL